MAQLSCMSHSINITILSKPILRIYIPSIQGVVIYDEQDKSFLDTIQENC